MLLSNIALLSMLQDRVDHAGTYVCKLWCYSYILMITLLSYLFPAVQVFPYELRDQHSPLDDISVDALGLLFRNPINRQRFERHFDELLASSTRAPNSAATAPSPATSLHRRQQQQQQHVAVSQAVPAAGGFASAVPHRRRLQARRANPSLQQQQQQLFPPPMLARTTSAVLPELTWRSLLRPRPNPPPAAAAAAAQQQPAAAATQDVGNTYTVGRYTPTSPFYSPTSPAASRPPIPPLPYSPVPHDPRQLPHVQAQRYFGGPPGPAGAPRNYSPSLSPGFLARAEGDREFPSEQEGDGGEGTSSDDDGPLLVNHVDPLPSLGLGSVGDYYAEYARVANARAEAMHMAFEQQQELEVGGGGGGAEGGLHERDFVRSSQLSALAAVAAAATAAGGGGSADRADGGGVRHAATGAAAAAARTFAYTAPELIDMRGPSGAGVPRRSRRYGFGAPTAAMGIGGSGGHGRLGEVQAVQETREGLARRASAAVEAAGEIEEDAEEREERLDELAADWVRRVRSEYQRRDAGEAAAEGDIGAGAATAAETARAAAGVGIGAGTATAADAIRAAEPSAAAGRDRPPSWRQAVATLLEGRDWAYARDVGGRPTAAAPGQQPTWRDMARMLPNPAAGNQGRGGTGRGVQQAVPPWQHPLGRPFRSERNQGGADTERGAQQDVPYQHPFWGDLARPFRSEQNQGRADTGRGAAVPAAEGARARSGHGGGLRLWYAGALGGAARGETPAAGGAAGAVEPCSSSGGAKESSPSIFKLVHEALTEDDEELVMIVLGLLPFSCPVKPRQQVLARIKQQQVDQWRHQGRQQQQGEEQEGAQLGQGQEEQHHQQHEGQLEDVDFAPHPHPAAAVVAAEEPPADVVHAVTDCIERGKVDMVKLVAGSGYSRSALAMAVAEQQQQRHPLYVSLRGLFMPDDVEAAVLRGVFEEGYAECSGGDMVLAHLKLLACSSSRPLLLVLDEVDAAASFKGGRGFRELLLQLRMVVPHMLLFVSSSMDPGGSWLDSALLMSCQQEEEYQLLDAGVRLVCYRQLAVMPFRSLTDVDYYHS